MNSQQVQETIERIETAVAELANHFKPMRETVDWGVPFLNEDSRAMKLREICADLQSIEIFLAKVKRDWGFFEKYK